MASLQPRSAFAGLPHGAGRGGGPSGLAITPLKGATLISLIARKGQAGALSAVVRDAFGLDLPTSPRRVEKDGTAFLWAGPQQWLAMRHPGDPSLADTLRSLSAGLASTVDVSDARALLRVSGPSAREVLTKGVPVDLHPRAFKPGDTTVTLVAHTGVQLWQTDEAPTFELACARSYADSFWRWLAASAAEVGFQVVELR